MHWSIILQESTWFLFTSIYFWYHSILTGSIDQKHAKTNEIWKTKQSNPPSFRLFPLAYMISRSFQTVRHMHEAWKREIYVQSQSSFVRVSSQISPRRAKKDSNIPSPGKTRSVKCPTPGPTKTIKFPPHAQPPLPPTGMTLIGAQ